MRRAPPSATTRSTRSPPACPERRRPSRRRCRSRRAGSGARSRSRASRRRWCWARPTCSRRRPGPTRRPRCAEAAGGRSCSGCGRAPLPRARRRASTPAGIEPLAHRRARGAHAPRRGATVGSCAAQGVAVKVISGDAPATVAAVAERAGIYTGARPVTGSEELPEDPEALEPLAEERSVFARLTPERQAPAGGGARPVGASRRDDRRRRERRPRDEGLHGSRSRSAPGASWRRASPTRCS